MVTTIPDATLRKARSLADAAKRDGLDENGPVDIAVAIEVIDLVAGKVGTAIPAESAQYLSSMLSLSHQRLALFAAKKRRGR